MGGAQSSWYLHPSGHTVTHIHTVSHIRLGRLLIRVYAWSCRRGTPHVWLGSIRPRSQCVGGMLLVQWCHKHVLNCHSAVRLVETATPNALNPKTLKP